MKNEITEQLITELDKVTVEGKEIDKMMNTSSCVPNSEIEKTIARFNENSTEKSWSELMETLLLWFNTGGNVLVPVETSFIDDEQSGKNSHHIPLFTVITAMSEEDEPFQECYTSRDEAATVNYSDLFCIPFEDVLKQCLAGVYETVVLNLTSDSLYLELDRDQIESLMGMKYDLEVSEVMRYSFLHGLYKKDDTEAADGTYPSIAVFPQKDIYGSKWRTAIAYTMIIDNTLMNTVWSFGAFNQEEKQIDAGSDVKLELMYRKDAVGKIGLRISDDSATDKLKNFTGTYRKVANWKDVVKHFPDGLGGMSTVDQWIAL